MTNDISNAIDTSNEVLDSEMNLVSDIEVSKTNEIRLNDLKIELEQLISSSADGKAKITVRQLVEWVGYQRRRDGAVKLIQNALDDLNLITEPDFNNSHINAQIEISKNITDITQNEATRPAHQAVDENASIKNHELVDQEIIEQHSAIGVDRNNHILTVGRLEAANKELISVNPNSEIVEATTLMLKHNFSQLPVMSTPREVKGVISWRSIVFKSLKDTSAPKVVSEYMDKHVKIGYEDSLFDIFNKISDSDYVLVRKPDRTISGIITPFDLSDQFRELSEAFIKIGQIEAILRLIIEKYYPPDIIKSAKDPNDQLRTINTVDDLTFGEYQRLLENEENWGKFFKAKISRSVMIKTLDEIRLIRNDVMHFDPDGVDIQQHNQLSVALDFFNQVKSLL